jgi:hypothetical protein
MGKKNQDPDPGCLSVSVVSESFESNFWVKILKVFDADPGSGTNIPDPQHW